MITKPMKIFCCLLFLMGLSLSLPQVVLAQSLYEYIKVEEVAPENFTQILLPTSVVPVEKVIKYEKRLTSDLAITREGGGATPDESTITLPKDSLMAVEYRLRYRSGGEAYEPLIYYTDYSEVSSGKQVSFASPAWLKAYDFIKNNTERDSLVLCWWHHGKRVKLFTGREPLTSKPSMGLLKGLSVPKGRHERATLDYLLKWIKDREGLEDDTKTKDMARFFCSKETEAKEILGLLTPADRPVYILVSSEDFQEINAMSRLAEADLKLESKNIKPMSVTGVAGDMSFINQWIKNSGITSYYAQIFPKYYALWYLGDYGNTDMKEALILKLLPLSTGHGQGLSYFQPVFRSDEAHVWVYRFIPQGLAEPASSARMGIPGGHGGGSHGSGSGGHGGGYDGHGGGGYDGHGGGGHGSGGGHGGGYDGHGGGHGY
ncbi:MAG TPA: hypothetical protein ACFYEA_06930 [Candidatus Tripitaka californicus]|uniref:hypothetical protein n=2 Tax=Candidatus Tripitaka californicus TaxID=3367616 RepID=UPI0040269E56|nr:hypothetical protein [Planctomycetota bacterium]